jgi:hypothetical protein
MAEDEVDVDDASPPKSTETSMRARAPSALLPRCFRRALILPGPTCQTMLDGLLFPPYCSLPLTIVLAHALQSRAANKKERKKVEVQPASGRKKE